MAPIINVTKKLDNNFVQVEIESKNVPKRFFKVPENRSDEFCKSYNKFSTEQSIWSPIRIITPILLVTSTVNLFAKKLGKAGQWIAAIGAGIATAAGVINLNTQHIIKCENKLLQKHNAEEFIQEPQKLSFLNKSK